MKRTVLFDRHKNLNAKIVNFAGYMMPISYSSVNEEHIHVRNKVGIFDVSHMGEFEISGLNSLEFVQHLCSNDISKIDVGKAQYNCLTNESGGIIDDLIVYRLDLDKFLLVDFSQKNLSFHYLHQIHLILLNFLYLWLSNFYSVLDYPYNRYEVIYFSNFKQSLF